jgi:hypothetical protein
VAAEECGDRARALLRQRIVVLVAARRVGVGIHIDIGLVEGLQRPRDLVERGVELRPDGRAIAVEGERRRDADQDSVADANHVDPDAGGLRAQLAVGPCHIIERSRAA